MTRPVVLAFGGNALVPDPSNPAGEEQRAEELADAVLLVFPKGAGMALVHGNGPQVGTALLRVEATRQELPPETLDVMVAQTQGSIGYLLAQTLRNVLGEQHLEVSTVMTQVVVDAHDPAFGRPTKPVGPFYTKQQADGLQGNGGWAMAEIPGRGWRRVVPSPRPLEVVELEPIRKMLQGGQVVIAGGGGGVPVVRGDDGRLRGVEAVIDKDRTASLLAIAVQAAMLVILTGEPHVARAFGTPDEERIPRMGPATARSLLQSGEFPPGSMGPKVEAALAYVEALGSPAVITDTPSLQQALQDEAGTWIEP